MKLRNMILMLSVILMIAAGGVLAKPDNAGTADKITGGLEIITNVAPITAQVEFTAHAATGNRPAKGMFRWYRPDQPRTIVCEVTYVTVNGNAGAFVGKKTYDTTPGNPAIWIVVKVDDGGSPGTNNDKLGIIWFLTEEKAIEYANGDTWPDERPIIAGNLVVHSK
jgi:hypothetical protein